MSRLLEVLCRAGLGLARGIVAGVSWADFKSTPRLMLLVMVASSVHAAVVSRDWSAGKLALKLDDGTAEIEWLSPVAFRVARSFGNAPLPSASLAHEAIAPAFEDTNAALTMKSKYLTVTVDRADTRIHVRSGETAVTDQIVTLDGGKAAVRLSRKAGERIFGLMGQDRLERARGFLFTTAGYGMYTESACSFDVTAGTIEAPGAAIEYDFYYGPTAKEIMEQHATVHPLNEVKAAALELLPPDRLPKEAVKLPAPASRTWQGLAGLIRTLNAWSLSAVVYPALDAAMFDGAPAELKARFADVASIFPLVYRAAGEGGIDVETRRAWTPYLITYLREASDRGYPLIRPLAMQFSRDAASGPPDDVFMLGDEILAAPVMEPGEKRSVRLPRGNWTDVRTNQEYRGNQTVTVDAPAGRVPMFVRNGWIIPLARADRMELHYYPSLGGEFFLWEPDVNENSQFHAAPAGDFMRLEVESQKRRSYEWVVHHVGAPKEVAEESGAYRRAESRERMEAGTWWHDAASKDLHLMLRADAKTDRIVNISF